MTTQVSELYRQAAGLHQSGQLAAAADLYQQLLQIQPRHFEALYYGGALAAQMGRFDAAQELIARAVKVKPRDAGLICMLGDILCQLSRLPEAEQAFRWAIKLNPKFSDAYYKCANTLLGQQRFAEALDCLRPLAAQSHADPQLAYLQGIALFYLLRHAEASACFAATVKLKPDFADAHYHFGLCLSALHNLPQAISEFSEAIRLNPGFADAYRQRGIYLHKQKQNAAGLADLRIAVALQPSAEMYCDLGVACHMHHLFDEAVENFRLSLRASGEKPAVLSYLGLSLHQLQRYKEALSHFDRALQINPDFAAAWRERGETVRILKGEHAAMASFEQAIRLQPNDAEAYFFQGQIFGRLKLIPQALASFDKALSLKADLDFLAGDRLFAAMQIFAPIDLDIELAGLTGRLAQGDKLLTPLICLAACDDPALHFTAAETWTNYFCPPNPQLGKAPVNANHQRIRIAYFSGDFREHPVALLTAQLFAYHDRNHFEVYAFSFSRHAKDEMRLRLEQVFEHFIDISDKTDMEAAQLARALQIDIAVDLNGHTIHARTGIFALRAAPIQVNYLGYPGTMAAPYMDYLIADQVIITAASRAAYAENMAFLPGSYLPNDTGRAIAESRPSRIACGLPENGFVFCCFNNAYKLTGRMFAVWMRILAAVPGSVLWVSTAAPARENMLAQAQEHGVNPSRLVFAERVDSQAEHLVRLQLADLFLDTLPYNAHATAVDALWAGLPVLTCPAKAFAGRVAASLLTAIEMPELIAENLERYEVLAVEIAVNPDRAAGLKQKLAVNRLTTALFDTRQYARDLENAFRHMHQRCLDGLTPTDFAVADLSEGLH